MSEWSPGGNYSCPGTPNQTGRTFRYQFDDPEKGIKTTNINVPGVSENRNRTFQQHSMEDVSKPSSFIDSKNKKRGNGASDPRFKRVISSGVQNDACVGTDVKNSKPSLVSKEKGGPLSKLSLFNVKEFKPNQPCANSTKSREQSKFSQLHKSDQRGCEKLTAAADSNFDQSRDHLKAVDKLSFNHDLVVNSLLKDSISDCTVDTRNTSFVSDEFTDELNELGRAPSVTRIKKVQTWIHDQTPKIDKKHSVVTVIGQMQGPDTLSSAFQEIDKRRKLVKELDRYAVCKKITESDKENENYDSITNINCVTTSERVLFTDANEALVTCLPKTKDGEDNVKKRSFVSNIELPENSTMAFVLSVREKVMSIVLNRQKSSTSTKKLLIAVGSISELDRFYINTLLFAVFLCGVYKIHKYTRGFYLSHFISTQ